MRILWVKPGGLWPLNTGGRLRSFHLISELSRRHDLTVLTTHSAADDPQGLTSHLSACRAVESVPYTLPKRGTTRFGLAVARSWLSRYPADLWRWRPAELRARVRQQLAESPDLCVADFLVAMPNLPRTGFKPTLLFEHNVEHMIWKRLHEVETRWPQRLLLALEARKMQRYEAWACARAQLTVAVSEVDRAVLAANAPSARIRAIGTGVDTSYFAPNGKPEAPATLVFTGSMDWYPNEDAIVHFIDAILPTIRREVSSVSLTVVGRNPTDRVKAAGAAAGVNVTGTVPDVRPYMAQATVYVVPLRIGGGTRLKIFEALAMGKAVVATGVGAEGLPIVSGEHFLQADSAGEFARAVTVLLKNAERRKALGLAGRRLVERCYSWPQIARELERHCETLVSDRAE
jgi:sugar transferase (PEP-CTERM/EpsH1 system associated)